ncbi:MAG: hypothetical protein K2V38_23765, partial [Gemmataceae bacterium]|nr:hypothetical protein [Gemmataceae bacterium]
MRTIVLAMPLVLAAGSHPLRAEGPPTPRATGDLAIRARATFRTHCAKCHTGTDKPGESKLDLLRHEQVTSTKPPIAFASADGKSRSLILELLADGSMPPANRPPPSADEVAALKAWVAAGAPHYPPRFDDAFVRDLVARDDKRSKSSAHVSF